ncbi:DUF202 domain-containing protein [Nocardia sp. NPDC059229]|uniref:DUF202 domain-containing protein n=1 Tax=Nocardia sp. NPDC059229 TaxID=3346778 RepID=UPI00369F066E
MPGLQPERTVLSWQRTLLTATATLAVSARSAVGHHSAAHTAAALAVTAVLAVTMAGTGLRHRRCRHRPADPRPLPHSIVACLCAGIGVAAGCVLLTLT